MVTFLSPLEDPLSMPGSHAPGGWLLSPGWRCPRRWVGPCVSPSGPWWLFQGECATVRDTADTEKMLGLLGWTASSMDLKRNTSTLRAFGSCVGTMWPSVTTMYPHWSSAVTHTHPLRQDGENREDGGPELSTCHSLSCKPKTQSLLINFQKQVFLFITFCFDNFLFFWPHLIWNRAESVAPQM